MEFNRNQYLMAGLVVFMLGVQLRVVDGFVLNDRATHFLHQRVQQFKSQQFASAGESASMLDTSALEPNHRLHPPKWLGWSLVSLGSVLVLYSLVLKKPGG